MKKTALITSVLATALVLALGSSWAEEPEQQTGESRISDEMERLLAERLAGGEPGQLWGDLIIIREPDLRQWRISPQFPPVTPCLAQSGSAESGRCAAAEALSRMKPCHAPGDCPAVEAWRQVYGLEEPRIVPAQPAAPPSVPALASTKEEE